MQLSYMVEAYDHPATRTGRYSGLKKDQPLKYKPKEKHVAEMET